MTKIDLTCSFCVEINQNMGDALDRIFPDDDISRTYFLKGSCDIVVFPDILPIRHGHLLISPISHFRSYCHWARSSPSIEIRQIVSCIKELFTEYENVLLFEHGSNRDKSIERCVDHAHIHALPCTALEIVNLLHGIDRDGVLKKRNSDNLFEDYSSLFDHSESEQDYVFLSYSKENKQIYHVYYSEPLMSQYIRKVFARENQIAPAIYDIDARKGSICKSINRLSENLIPLHDDY